MTPNHGFEAKVIEDSMADHGVRLVTLQLRYPRFIHAELMTHRVFSRNAGSSRAIPVAKMIAQVRDEPAMPIHWGKNQPGMQAREEHSALVELDGAGRSTTHTAQEAWRIAAADAAEVAEAMAEAGYHKQVANRILEPFQFISVIVTATDWDNFFILRDHEDAQPEIRFLAQLMKQAMDASSPTYRYVHDWDNERGWHLPYVSTSERYDHASEPDLLAKISAARCARVSYLTHDAKTPRIEDDLALYDRLVGSVPLHASPVEHQAQPLRTQTPCRNFRGWKQFRTVVESMFNDDAERNYA